MPSRLRTQGNPIPGWVFPAELSTVILSQSHFILLLKTAEQKDTSVQPKISSDDNRGPAASTPMNVRTCSTENSAWKLNTFTRHKSTVDKHKLAVEYTQCYMYVLLCLLTTPMAGRIRETTPARS